MDRPLSEPSELNRAKSLIADGRLGEASRICRRLIDKTGNAEALYLLAVVSGQTGMHAEALTLFQEAARKLPGRSDVTYNFGVILNGMGKTVEAIEQWEATLAVNPTHADALFNLGRARADNRAWADAAELFEHLAALRPGDPRVLLNLGNACFRMGRLDRARSCFGRIVEADEGHVDARINLGLTEYRDGRPDAAIRHLRRAIQLDPDNPRAHINIAQALLFSGNLRDGYGENEWRRKAQTLRFPVSGQSPWTGDDLAGRRILLYGEQGQGDTIHFLRYVPAVAAKAAGVGVYCHPSLTGIAAAVDGVGHVAAFGETPPPFDCYAPLMSLPLLLGMTGIDAIPPAPYVAPVPAAALPGNGKKPRVGLAWAGNPEHEDDASRSCPLAAMKPLIETAGIDFFSLQVGDAAAEIDAENLTGAITDLGRSFKTFADTARAIQALDLVISVDTAVAHLAGAMGRPVWLMLPRVPDWRWFAEGAATPWYPSMRLCRQTDDGGWPPVVRDLAAALSDFAKTG
jgi:Flp pilus assembly protein TadD